MLSPDPSTLPKLLLTHSSKLYEIATLHLYPSHCFQITMKVEIINMNLKKSWIGLKGQIFNYRNFTTRQCKILFSNQHSWFHKCLVFNYEVPYSQINSHLQTPKIYTSQYRAIYWICAESINNPLIMSCLLEEETESNSVLHMIRNQTPAKLQLVQIYYWKCFNIFKISRATLNHKNL